MDPCDIEVGEKRRVGFMEVVVAFEQWRARGGHDGLEKRSRTARCNRVVSGGEEEMLKEGVEDA